VLARYALFVLKADGIPSLIFHMERITRNRMLLARTAALNSLFLRQLKHKRVSQNNRRAKQLFVRL
jgi:hypothetical protein